MKRCKTCKGKYEPIQDGVKYFHKCPPIWDNDKQKFKEMPNARDENISNSGNNKGKMKKEGKGTEDI